MSYDKYRQAQRNTETPRQTEYRIFGQMIVRLRKAKEAGKKQDIIQAVAWNRRFWLALQMDLSLEGNRLPDQLKAQLISMSIFIDKYSGKVIRGEEDIDLLIELNQNIMAGLAPNNTRTQQAPLPAAGV